jgi:hypothetical protein
VPSPKPSEALYIATGLVQVLRTVIVGWITTANILEFNISTRDFDAPFNFCA